MSHVKLTRAQVSYIKWMLTLGGGDARIAREIGVSSSCISRIRRGITWKDVPVG